jgi:hypothetical protein
LAAEALDKMALLRLVLLLAMEIYQEYIKTHLPFILFLQLAVEEEEVMMELDKMVLAAEAHLEILDQHKVLVL